MQLFPEQSEVGVDSDESLIQLMTPELVRKAHSISLFTRRPVFARSSGDFRTRYRGTGMQFKEFRPYVPGDDIRYMSWTVTARTRRPTVKVFEEERELHVCLLVDTSSSSLATWSRSRFSVYRELSALLGLAGLSHGGSLSQICFQDRISYYGRASRKRSSLLAGLKAIRPAAAPAPTSIERALSFLDRAVKHRGLVFILSDFMSPSFDSALARAARKHEVFLVNCIDPLSSAPRGVCEARDPETDKVWLLDLGSKSARARYAEHIEVRRKRLAQISAKAGADYCEIATQNDCIDQMVAFLNRRSGL